MLELTSALILRTHSDIIRIRRDARRTLDHVRRILERYEKEKAKTQSK